jgi:hypothetical protein
MQNRGIKIIKRNQVPAELQAVEIQEKAKPVRSNWLAETLEAMQTRKQSEIRQFFNRPETV